jgi:hypothetical protein
MNIGEDGMNQRSTRNEKHPAEPGSYEIHVKEPIDPCWAAWFDGMTIRQAENGETIISGPVVDKAALHGLLAMIGELNLTLLSVKKLESSASPTGGNHEK